MLSITQSHNMDDLFTELCLFLGAKTNNPFQALTVLVPSLAVGRWLTYEWATQFGVCANVNAEYPANFMWDSFGKIVPETPKSAILSPEAMQWRLFAELANLPNEPIYQVLQRYLERTPQPLLGRWQLAGRIAEVFGHYRNYRRDWLALWRDGKFIDSPQEKPFRHQEWQAALWQKLFAEEHHQQGHLLSEFQQQLQAKPHLRQRLPQQLAVFTTVRLPPNELDFFRVLSQFVEVKFFHLNPCGQYWADIVDERWLAKMKARQSKRMNVYDKGHPLLTAWGKQLRDTFRLLSELSGGEQENDWQDIFPEITPTHLLSTLQHSIHEMQHEEQATWQLAPDDDSIQIHSCHSLTRQLEVLHDKLLDLFKDDSSLKPQDIVVMLPDVASASGAIEAVFGTVAEERRIAWQLTGVASPEENSLWRAFDGLYQLTQGRLTQSEFIDWLSLAPVMAYYKLAAEDLEQCVLLLEQAAVYRCLDGQHRAQVTGDSSDIDVVHTFLFGLERLLLATVLPPDYQQTYAGIQPVAHIEAGSFELIGTLTQAVSDLAARRTWLQQRQATSVGLQLLQQDLQTFFIAQVGTRAWENLNKAIEEMRSTAQASTIDETVPLSLLLHDLHQRMEASAPGAVPGGVVHFSRLGALRLLPYRVVCILGLEDTAYPRREIPNEFDLLAQDQHPRAGDRSRRDDDKGVFLEALMSAQDHLLLFYNGFSNNQAAVFPPSTMINQLVDYLGRRVIGGKSLIQRQCWFKHRLQPFSPQYFQQAANNKDEEKAFADTKPSYAAEWLSAAQAVVELPVALSHFVNATVPIDDNSHNQTLSLDVLHRFYQHPAKYFLSKQLKLHIEELSEHHADEEPLRLDHFAKWQLRTELLTTEKTPYLQLRASGQLPVGVIGEVYCQQSQDALQQLKTALRLCQRDVVNERVELVLTASKTSAMESRPILLTASLAPISEPYQLGYVVSKLSAKHLLRAWFQHLTWQAAGANAKTIWLFLNEVWLFAPLPKLQAENYLQVWLHYYQQGLQRPLLLAVESALEFANVLNNPKKSEDDAVFAASKKWSEEVQDSYWRQVVPENQRETLPIEFAKWVDELYVPILEQGKKIKWLELSQELPQELAQEAHHD